MCYTVYIMKKILVIPLLTLPACIGAYAMMAHASIDADGDGLSDHEERAIYQTFWYDVDTDGDGFADGDEVNAGYSPKQPNLTMKEADTDNDGLNDDWEIKLGSNLMIRDTDGDGYLDGTEVYYGYSPTDPRAIKVGKSIVASTQTLRLQYFLGDIMLDDVPISTGKSATPTPTGDFEVMSKVPVKHYLGDGYSYPNTLWNLHFTTGRYKYYIHGAYWHDNFGIAPVSESPRQVRCRAGCRAVYWHELGDAERPGADHLVCRRRRPRRSRPGRSIGQRPARGRLRRPSLRRDPGGDRRGNGW